MAASSEEDSVLWVKFEKWDINDSCIFDGLTTSEPYRLPLLIIMGYNNGLRIWLCRDAEIQLVFSLLEGPVKIAHILPTPIKDSKSIAERRPIIAICDASSEKGKSRAISFLEMRTGECFQREEFESEVDDIKCNKKVVLAVLKDGIILFKAHTLTKTFMLKTYFCEDSSYTSAYPNPVALNSSWLAYAGERIYLWIKSPGGIADIDHSYTTEVAESTEIPETPSTLWSASDKSNPADLKVMDIGTLEAPIGELLPGIVTVIDYEFSISKCRIPEVDYPLGMGRSDMVVANFFAHIGEPLAVMASDPLMNLLTISSSGKYFNMFKMPDAKSHRGYVHHLCTVHFDDTSKVQDIAFSSDAHWISLSTSRATLVFFEEYNTDNCGQKELSKTGASESKESEIIVTARPFAELKRLAEYANISVQKPTAEGVIQCKKNFDKNELYFAVEFSPIAVCEGSHLSDKEIKTSLFIIDCYGNLFEYELIKFSDSDPRLCDYAAVNKRTIPVRGPFENEAKPPLAADNPLIAYQRTVFDFPCRTLRRCIEKSNNGISKLKTQTLIEEQLTEAMKECPSMPSDEKD